jgi:hypothetical protein
MEEKLTFRLTSAEMARLRRLAGPIHRGLVARAAMNIGLDYFEKHREALLSIEPIPPGRKPRRKPPR